MKTPLLGGKVTPPPDLHEAAIKTLGYERYLEFVKKYGDDFTPAELCKFHEDRN